MRSWLEEYEIPVHEGQRSRTCNIATAKFSRPHFENGQEVKIDYIFTTRGDIFHTKLAEKLGAKLDEDGQIEVDLCMRTTVPGLYAAGCVTPANCQMIIAAGQGAAAAQAINRDLFEESLRPFAAAFREAQLADEKTSPESVPSVTQRRKKRDKGVATLRRRCRL